jgi:hypothetical protein
VIVICGRYRTRDGGPITRRVTLREQPAMWATFPVEASVVEADCRSGDPLGQARVVWNHREQ